MKVTIEMDCMALTMTRADNEPQWQATITSAVNPDKGVQMTTVALDDNQAAATAALACGINGEAGADAQTAEKLLYVMTGNVWDGVGIDLRPIP